MKELTLTQKKILSQLKENTGRALCDSGDAYGRNWQRNQNKTWEDFTKNPVQMEAHVYKHGDKPELELMGYVSLASWLDANVEFDAKMQRRYDTFVKRTDPDNEQYDLERMEAFAEKISDGRHWCGSDYPSVVNSYNGECDLTQTIQFVEFAYQDEVYVLLQVHGGCDVRGGYTSPVAYKVTSDYFGDWVVDGYGCASHQWDESMCNANDYKLPSLKDYPVHELVWVSKLEHELECLKQTNKDLPAVRESMRQREIELEKEAFEEFCDALTEHSVVVYKRKAYFVGDEGPEEIYGDCRGLFN